jgi:GNAT superfamily N-acetyltransferase
VEDILAGHRATGEHDPGLWWAAVRGGRPVGVLLLTRFPERRSLEVVYVGVAQVVRGQGVGDALMGLALEVCARLSATTLALAVDSANTFARRMYDRWGFEQTGARDAWIATPSRA